MKPEATPPQPVDPTVAINAQSQANEATARLQQTLNNVNTVSPYGSVTYSQDPSNPDRWTQTTSLSPAEQQTYNLQKQAVNNALGIANTQAGRVNEALGRQPDLSIYNGLKDGIQRNDISYAPNQPPETRQETIARGDISFTPNQPPETYQESINRQALPQVGQQAGYQQQVGPTDFSADRNAVTDATFQQYMSRLNPEFGRLQSQLDTRLANQGIGINSAAHGNAQDEFARGRNDAYAQAAYNAVNAGAQEQQRLFEEKLAQGQFANQAVNAQNADTLNFGAQRLGAQQQDYAQQIGQANLYNDVQGRNEAQTMARLQQQNAAQNQQFNQNLAAGQFYNSAQDANDANNLAYWGQGLNAQNQGFNQNLAAAQFSNQARQQGLQEQSYLQNVPINQLSALLGLGQVGTPQGIQYTPTQVANTDALGAYALNQQGRNANYQAALGQQNALLGGLAGLGQAAILASDRRLKRDIVKLGERDDGLGIYLYRYANDNAPQIGVMAQEVLEVKPHAVVRMANGYWAVDYGAL